MTKIIRHIILFLLFSGVSLGLTGQSFSYRNYRYHWEEMNPKAIAVESQFLNEPAVILDEKTIYNIIGDRVPAYSYFVQRLDEFIEVESNSGKSPIVRKHLRVKFLTEEGIKKYSKFILPESFNPSADFSFVNVLYRDSLIRPKGEYECINFFAARIIKPDGKIMKADIDEIIVPEINRANQIDRKFYNWIFKITNLKVGDELEVDYSYTGAFSNEVSRRIFFNSDLPKQNYKLTFRYSSRDVYILNYHNGAEPNDSIMVTKGTPSYTEYIFTRKNLQGGINESGGRPHLELPYISFYKHLMDFGEMDPKTKFITKAHPYQWAYMMLPYVGYQLQNLRVRLGRNDRTTVALNTFLQEEKNKAIDTAFASIMSSIHHTIAFNFNYKDDIEAIQGDDKELEKLGKYVERKTLWYQSRLRLYEELFMRFDKDYYGVLLCDKRVASMEMNRYDFLNVTRYAFAIPYRKSLIYFYPKSNRYGYESNELPFYYEDITTFLIPQHEPYDKQFQKLPDVEFMFVNTPFSTENENVRITNAMMNATLDSLKLNVNARISLMGQFSTLIRPYYLNQDRDTTVNPNYYILISDAADEQFQVDNKVTNIDTKFPYEASITSTFRNDSKLLNEKDNTFSIDLNKWFNDVIDDRFSYHNRHMNYYPDFRLQDIHRYKIGINKKIKLLNSEEIQKEILNSYGSYSVRINQPDDTSIYIETIFTVKSHVVSAQNAKEVSDIFDAIKTLNNSMIKFAALK